MIHRSATSRFRLGIALRGVAAHLGRRAEWYLVPLFFAALVAWFYRQVWEGEVGIGWDLIESYWPDLAFLANEFGRGNFPLWNPYERGGYPAHADPQPALFYPVQWLFALWGAWRGETSWTLIQVKELAHLALTGALVHLFLRTRRLPWQAALLGGVVVVVSGPWFVNKSHNYIHTLAWTPLVWIMTDRLLARPSVARGCALAAALYLPGSSGSPPGYFYVLLMAGGYGLLRAGPWVFRRAVALAAPADRDRAVRDLARLGGALAAAVALVAATQLLVMLPTRELLAASPRAVRTVEFALSGYCAVKPVMHSLLVPNTSWSGSNLGLVTMALAGCIALRRPLRDGGAPLFFLAAGAMFLTLSFGGETPVLAWAVRNLPGFNMFRVSCRYAMGFGLFAACAAAYGLALLFELRARPPLRRLFVPALVGVTVVLLVRWILELAPHAAADPAYPRRPWLIVALSLGGMVGVLFLPRRRAAGVVAALLPLLVVVDTTEHFLRAPGFEPRPDNLQDRAKVASLDGLDEYRVYDEFLLEQRAGSRLGLREFRGYPANDPLTLSDYVTVVNAGIHAPQVLAEYNIRYIFYGPHSLKGWNRKQLAGAPDELAPGRFRRLGPAIFEALAPAPMAAWYGGVQVVPRGVVMSAVGAARDTAGVRRVAVIAAEEAARSGLAAALDPMTRAAAPPSVPGRVTHLSTEEVEVEIEAPAAGVVVLNEVMFPGWRVEVDGRPERGFAVDLFLRGVVVPAGFHRVRWVYRPPAWGMLVALWWTGMSIFLLAGVASLGPGRRWLDSRLGRALAHDR